MKIKIKLILIIISIIGFVFPTDIAYTLNTNEREIGVFQPFKYGIKNDVEISIHPILFFIMPNFSIKKYHKNFNNIGISSRYGINYPTYIINLLKKDGIGGFLSNENNIKKVPHFLTFRGEILATQRNSNHSITTKIGATICSGSNLDERDIIEYDLIYPRMTIYKYGWGTNIGIDWNYNFLHNLRFKSDLDLLLIKEEKPFIEHKLIIDYSLSDNIIISSGYKLSYGYYPFNIKTGLFNLFPIIDIKWKWKK